VVGRWAGGADDRAPENPDHPYYSRLDWEFYHPINGNDNAVPRIKGMPGCKSFEMCGFDTNATELGVGRFKLSNDAVSRYGLGNITCTLQQCGG
jgi:hypothetical protein